MADLSYHRWMMFWPGLPAVRLAGSWKGFGVAVGFAWLLAVMIWARWGWPEWLSADTLSWLGWATLLFWLVAIPANCRSVRRIFEEHERIAAEEDGLRVAVAAYLGGQWARAESLLSERLRQQPHDAESRLLLGSLLVRRHRDTEAREEFLRLLRSDGGARWVREIRHEMSLLAADATEN